VVTVALAALVTADPFDGQARAAPNAVGKAAATGGVRLARGRAATERREQAEAERRREARRRARTPQAVICRVFGAHCRQALAVAHCESRFETDAENGQYLGLFQMGSYARDLYGHGASAETQARAAHRYFVESGRDWSPWGCKP
jgi:hypothetical protein